MLELILASNPRYSMNKKAYPLSPSSHVSPESFSCNYFKLNIAFQELQLDLLLPEKLVV